MKKLSRRRFIRLSGVTAAGAMLVSCAPKVEPTSVTAKTAETVPSATAVFTAAPTVIPSTPTPAETPTPAKAYYHPELVKFHPAQKSRVVRASSAEAWKGDTVAPEVLRQMLDKAIVALTGISEAKKAWQALFKPEEKIAIKVNAFRNSLIWTKPELVKAVTDSLQEAGIPGEQITIFDYYTNELETAGFKVNKDGPGVRCYGTDQAYATRWDVDGYKVQLSDILVQADALINMPVLKSHMIAGLTFALKNHYGSVSSPESLHYVQTKLSALNALPPIKDSTRLVIGDALSMNTKYSNSFPYWAEDAKGDSILMSFDPLAHDRVGMDILTKKAEEKGNSTKGIIGMADLWWDNCNQASIGTCDPKNIEIVDV